MGNSKHGLEFGSFVQSPGNLIFNCLWFAFLFILIVGIARFIFDNLPFMEVFKNLIYKNFPWMENLAKKYDSLISKIYKILPDKIYYLFLLRVPIVGGIILFFFPFIAQFFASNFLQNIFVMENGIQLISVMVCATCVAITIVSQAKTILVLTDEKFENRLKARLLGTIALFLPTWGLLLYLNNETTNLEDIGWSYRALGIFIGIVPLFIAQLYEFRNDPKVEKLKKIMPFRNVNIEDLGQRRIYIFIGEIVVGIVFYILVITFNWPSSSTLKDWQDWQAPTLLYALLLIWILTLLVGIVALRFDKSIDKQIDRQKKSLLDYIAPNQDDPQNSSALNRSDLENQIKSYKLYNHTFYWPVILLLIIFSGLGYGIWGVDHYFKLEDSQLAITDYQDYRQDFQESIWNRLCDEKFDENKKQICDNNNPKSLAVVAASGGGIQASGWMTQVLAGLQDKELGIGEDFTKAIGLISSASGGSVGSMFYLNEFENGVLSDRVLKKDGKDKYALAPIVKNATDDWLNSVGWGLAFPDLFRAIGLPCVLQKFSELGVDKNQYVYLDRGYALEKNWQKTLTVENQKPPTLDDRYKQILAGEIPIPVYNTTLVENGRPFFISPLKFVPGKMADSIDKSSDKDPKTAIDFALDFRTLYNNCGENGNNPCDLALTTAARLSASFPYVTPMSRNDRDNFIKNEEGQNIKIKDENGQEKDFLQNYHIADGGYYDNAGAFTAMNWLNNFLKYNNSANNEGHRINIKKVLILQINAFPEDKLQQYQQGSPGFLVTTLGPVETLAGIRDSTQIGRNKIFAKLLKDSWNDENIDIRDFTISFPQKDKDGKDYNPPLSWRLTKAQKENLVKAWQEDPIQTTVQSMKDFWQG